MGTESRFHQFLDEAVAFHGHLCAGQVIGVKMAMLGLKHIGIDDPRGKDRKNLIVFLEIDRCAADAILCVTGCKPGRRSLKIFDYGKMAATFVNLETGKAFRVAAKQVPDKTVNAVIAKYFPEKNKENAYTDALMFLSDEALFDVKEVSVHLRPEDLPGKPLRTVQCERCGETVLDGREISESGKNFCRTCAEGKSYYTYELHS